MSLLYPVKVIGRVMTKEEADIEEAKGNHVTEVEGGYRRIVASPILLPLWRSTPSKPLWTRTRLSLPAEAEAFLSWNRAIT